MRLSIQQFQSPDNDLAQSIQRRVVEVGATKVQLVHRISHAAIYYAEWLVVLEVPA